MKFSTEELLQGILAQDKRILGKAITLIESKKPEHRVLAEELLKKKSCLMPEKICKNRNYWSSWCREIYIY